MKMLLLKLSSILVALLALNVVAIEEKASLKSNRKIQSNNNLKYKYTTAYFTQQVCFNHYQLPNSQWLLKEKIVLYKLTVKALLNCKLLGTVGVRGSTHLSD